MKFKDLRKTLNEWDVTYVNKLGNKMASRNLITYAAAKNLSTMLKMQGATQIEIHEADLSKAQIKKVHDKADELPKNDFIKRYGKDGDSVRFATATKMVKKELGIDEKSTEEGRGYGTMAGPSGLRSRPTQRSTHRTINMPLSGEKPLKPVWSQNPLKKLLKLGEESTEVELDENIAGETVAQGYAKTIAKMTDSNDHFGARKYIAGLIKDKELSQMYDSLEKAHQLTNGAGNHAIGLRGKMETILKYRVGKKLRPDIAKIILGGL